jgi:hypothetical protein
MLSGEGGSSISDVALDTKLLRLGLRVWSHSEKYAEDVDRTEFFRMADRGVRIAAGVLGDDASGA